MTDGQITPSWPQIIRSAIEAALLETNTGLPARVEAFDPDTQTVNVVPLLRRAYLGPDDDVQIMTQPILQSVPVLWPGGNGWAIRWRLRPGDVVLLAFSQRSLDRWKSAPHGSLVDPADSRRHDLSDAIAMPGLRPPASPGLDPGEDLVIAHEDGHTEIRLAKDGTIKLGPEAARGVARIDDQTRVDQTTDSALIAFLGAVAGALNALAPGSVPSPPASITGRVSSGSDMVRSI